MFEIIQWIVTAGAGALLLTVSKVVFFPSEKRIKRAEAKTKEIEANTAEMIALQKQLDLTNERVDRLYRDLGQREQEAREKRQELAISEIKRYKLKNTISRAHVCKFEAECPVLARQRQLDEEYEQIRVREKEIQNA